MIKLSPKKVQKHATLYTDYNISISDLCSELSFFVVFDFQFNQQTPQNMKKKSTVITFRNDEITFKEIVNRYLKLANIKKLNINYRFTLSKGYRIPMKYTIADLKKTLRKSNLDGVVLFTQQVDIQYDSGQESSHSQQSDDYDNENGGLINYLKSQKDFNKQKLFTFHFILPNNKNIISIQINPIQKIQKLIQLFLKQIIKQYQIKLNLIDILDIIIQQHKISLNNKLTIQKHKKLYDHTNLQVIFKNKQLSFIKKQNSSQNIIILIKQYINIHGNKSYTKLIFNYNQIKNIQISNLNKKYFIDNNIRQNKYNPICLKILDIILKQNQTLYKINYIIQKLKQIGDIKIIGYFINQKIIFYKEISSILNQPNIKQFTLQELEIPYQSNQRQICRQKINQRVNIIKTDYFRNKQHIEPIFIYTSNLTYRDKQTKQIHKIYDSLNKKLRTDSLIAMDSKYISNHWVYRYTSTILKHLEKISNEKSLVYRGVNYDPQGKVGDFMTFKPFTSTSKIKSVALNFALQNYTQNLPLTIFQMQIFSGKSIQALSYYNTQKEILLQPFSEFIIKDIKKADKDYPIDIPITIYKLKEIKSLKQMPITKNNYLLWIDDKINQGKQIFNKYIIQFNSTIILFQINTTLQLKNWIKNHQDIFYQENSKIIMVTNMVRKEQDQIRNYYAGVESINLIRQSIPNIHIAVYVGDVNASKNNLKQKQVCLQRIQIISQIQQLTFFISKHLEIKFQNLFPIKQSQINQQSQKKNLSQQNKSKPSNQSIKSEGCNII